MPRLGTWFSDGTHATTKKTCFRNRLGYKAQWKVNEICSDSAPRHIAELFSKSPRSMRLCNQFNIVRVNTELGRSFFQYRVQ